MKTHAILVNISYFPAMDNAAKLIDYIHQYINVKLLPYNSIGVFAYKEFSRDKNPIFGDSRPHEFISDLKHYSNKVYETYSKLLSQQEITICSSTRIRSRTDEKIKAMQLISGQYLYESCFYNCETKSSIITSEEWERIINNIKNYVIIFLNLYR